jgi:hypothetical protein
LNNKGNIKDKIIQRIYESIKRLLGKISYTIVFDYLRRTKNQAGKILENIFRKNIKYLTRKALRNKIGKQLSYYKYKDYNLQYYSTIGYDLKFVMAY